MPTSQIQMSSSIKIADFYEDPQVSHNITGEIIVRDGKITDRVFIAVTVPNQQTIHANLQHESVRDFCMAYLHATDNANDVIARMERLIETDGE